MSTSFSLNDLFVVLNFVVFCGMVIWLFKKFRNPLQAMVDHEAALIPDLYKTIDAAQLKRENLETTRKQQLITIATITQKLHTWRSTIFTHNQQTLEEQATINAALAEKIRLQSDNYSMLYLKNKVAPESLSESAQLLQEFFKSSAAQKQYMNGILSYVKGGKE